MAKNITEQPSTPNPTNITKGITDLLSHIDTIIVTIALIITFLHNIAQKKEIKDLVNLISNKASKNKSLTSKELEINKSINEILKECRLKFDASRCLIINLHNGQYYLNGTRADKMTCAYEDFDLYIKPVTSSLMNIPVSIYARDIEKIDSKQLGSYDKVEDLEMGHLKVLAQTLGIKSAYNATIKDPATNKIEAIFSLQFCEYRDMDLEEKDIKYIYEKSEFIGFLMRSLVKD